MAFTSTSVANKGNKFRILFPRSTIRVIMQEYVAFTILEKVLMLIPAWPSQPLTFVEKTISNDYQGNGKLNIEVISVETVLESFYRISENHLQIFTHDLPKQILSCRTKDLSLIQRFIPDPSGVHNLAIAIYNYNVEVTYLNSMGMIKQVSLNSGTRHEQIFIRSSRGRLNVSINLACIYKDFTMLVEDSKSTAYIKRIPHIRPIRLWLKAKSIK